MKNIKDLTKFQAKVDFSFVDDGITLYPACTNIPGCIAELMVYVEAFICDLEDLKIAVISPSRR